MSPRRSITVALVSALLASGTAYAAAPTDVVISASSRTFRVNAGGIYTITVHNAGSAATDDTIRVNATLDSSLRFVSTAGSGWSCGASGRAVTCTNPNALTVGASTTLQLTVRVGRASTVTTVFTVAYPGDTNGTNNTVSNVTAVTISPSTRLNRIRRPRPGRVRVPQRSGTATPTRTPPSTSTTTFTPTATPLAGDTDLLLTASVNDFTVGALGTYVLTVTNTGPLATTAPITLTDLLPTEVDVASVEGAGWLCLVNVRAVTCEHAAALEVQAQTSVTLSVSVGAAAFPSVTNVATLSYAGDSNPANDAVEQRTTVRSAVNTPTPSSTRTSTPTPTRTPPVGPRGPTSTPTSTPTSGSAVATDVSLSGTNLGAYRVGKTAFYFLTITNLGLVATNEPIRVTDSLPNGIGFVTWIGAGWSCASSGPQVDCEYADSLPGLVSTALTLTFSVESVAVPSVTNIVTLSYPGDIVPGNNFASSLIVVRK